MSNDRTSMPAHLASTPRSDGIASTQPSGPLPASCSTQVDLNHNVTFSSMSSTSDLCASSACAIRATNLRKLYTRRKYLFSKVNTVILDNLDISIAKGQIYGLLGPSGCGKTTLLKCLIGLVDIDKGEISVNKALRSKHSEFLVDLDQLGFMPQDSCLFRELTIGETFFYFGKLRRMSPELIRQRQDFLIQLLELPSKNAFVHHLSGGQLRRTSFAVSLLHQPSLLMLDEPTVGMDPLLRKKIWNYLFDLSQKQGTTIVITTHYIEEARRADCLGFMLAGRIIEENAPEFLMSKYKQNILEDVFHSLCCRPAASGGVVAAIKNHNTSVYDEKHAPIKPLYRADYGGRIDEESDQVTLVVTSLSCADGDATTATASTATTPIATVTPNTDCEPGVLSEPNDISTAAQAVATSSYDKENWRRRKNLRARNNTKSLLCKSIKNDMTLSPSRLVANLYKDSLKCIRNKKILLINFFVPVVQITFFCLCIGRTPHGLPVGIFSNETESLGGYKLGHEILTEMSNETVVKHFYANFSDAYADLRRGTIWTLFAIDADFTSDLIGQYSTSLSRLEFKSFIHIYADNTNQQIYFAIQEAFVSAVKSVAERYHDILFSKSEHTSSDTMYPFKIEKPVYGSDKPVFTHFMAPGIALSVVFFMSVALTASNFVSERKFGLTERSHLAGVRTIELLVSQLVVYSIIMLIQIVIVLGLLFGFLNLPLKGSLVLLVVLIFSEGLCGLCYGLFLASIFFDEETVIQATLASFYPILLMSGVIWPIEGQPDWLQHYVSRLLPMTFANDSFRAILEKNWDLSHMQVLRGFLVSYAWSAFFCIAFLFIFSRKFRIQN